MATYLRDVLARLKWVVDDKALKANERVVDKQTRQADALQRKIAGVGKAVAAGLASAGVVRELQKAADSSIAFARTLSDLQSLLPGQTERVEELGTGIRALAVEFGGDAVTMSKAAYQIVSAVGDTSETLDSLRVAQTLANASVSDAATAFDLMSAVTLAYGDSSLAAQKHVSDLAIRTVQLGKTTLPELTAAVGKAAPAFAGLNVTQEELFGTIAGLAGVSGSTSEAMTQMSAIASTLTNRSDAMSKAFRKLGVKTAAELIGKKGFNGALIALRDTTDGTAEALTKLLGREEAMRAANVITGAGAARVATSLSEMGKAAGAAAKSADAVRSGAGAAAFEMDKMDAKADELQRSIGDRVAKPMADARQAALDLADAISKDLTNSMDIFEAEADSFADSDGFKAIALLRGFASAAASVADTAVTAGGVIATGSAALGASGVSLVTGDAAGAGRVFSQGDADIKKDTKGLLSRLSVRGGTIKAAFGDREAADVLQRRAGYAEATLLARKETARALEERGIVRSPAEMAARRIRPANATINGVTINIANGMSPDQATNAMRQGFGEALGDALGSQVPDPTVWQ